MVEVDIELISPRTFWPDNASARFCVSAGGCYGTATGFPLFAEVRV